MILFTMSSIQDIESLGTEQRFAPISTEQQQQLRQHITDILPHIHFDQSETDIWNQFRHHQDKFRKEHRWIPKKSDYLACIMSLTTEYPDICRRIFLRKSIRSDSGVLVVTVFTTAYPTYTDADGIQRRQRFSCRHDCYYCPNEPGHPRSYLANEPGVRRAVQNDYDCVRQFRSRINTYMVLGHPIDKLEVLVLGGTWSEYPTEYQEEFIRDIYYAANTLFHERPLRQSLEEEMLINETADVRIIGLTLETRPDTITPHEIRRFRRFGCTRLQIGIQHTDDAILETINRGHTIQQAIDAMKLLKDNGYKIDIHIMPNLPGSTVDIDRAMFQKIIFETGLQADQWKIYPCSVTPWTVIERWHRDGIYVPYSDEMLEDMLEEVLTWVPEWVRLNRVIRDIPTSYISGGCSKPHMRDALADRMRRKGLRCRDIRAREVRGQRIENATLVCREYFGNGGREFFLSFESIDHSTIYGFLRLRFPGQYTFLPELTGAALIRELHVYGKLQRVGIDGDQSQHRGFGTQLIAEAERITRNAGYKKVAIISGIGVRQYYARRGYHLEGTFMVKEFEPMSGSIKWYMLTGILTGMLTGILVLLNHFKHF